MKKVLKIDRNDGRLDMRFYKSEGIELSYYGFEEGYIRDTENIFGKARKIKKNEWFQRVYSKIMLRFWIDFKEKDDYFEIDTYSLIYLFFIVWLLNFGIPIEKIKKHYQLLLDSWKRYHYWKYLFAFYVYQAIAWYQVNFYISKDFCLLLTAREFNALKWLNLEDNDLIIISLNNILSSIFHKDYSSKKDTEFHLNKEEQKLLFELNFGMYDKTEIKIKMKDWKIKELEILGKENDLSKTKKLEASIPHWEITKKRYKGKNQYLKIKEIKNLENDEDN